MSRDRTSRASTRWGRITARSRCGSRSPAHAPASRAHARSRPTAIRRVPDKHRDLQRLTLDPTQGRTPGGHASLHPGWRDRPALVSPAACPRGTGERVSERTSVLHPPIPRATNEGKPIDPEAWRSRRASRFFGPENRAGIRRFNPIRLLTLSQAYEAKLVAYRFEYAKRRGNQLCAPSSHLRSFPRHSPLAGASICTSRRLSRSFLRHPCRTNSLFSS
jgi:hypothetical protein